MLRTEVAFPQWSSDELTIDDTLRLYLGKEGNKEGTGPFLSEKK